MRFCMGVKKHRTSVYPLTSATRNSATRLDTHTNTHTKTHTHTKIKRKSIFSFVMTNRQTNRQTDKQTDRQTDRQTDKLFGQLCIEIKATLRVANIEWFTCIFDHNRFAFADKMGFRFRFRCRSGCGLKTVHRFMVHPQNGRNLGGLNCQKVRKRLFSTQTSKISKSYGHNANPENDPNFRNFMAISRPLLTIFPI